MEKLLVAPTAISLPEFWKTPQSHIVVINEPTTLDIPINGNPISLTNLAAIITSALSPDYVKQITPALLFGKS